MINKLIRNKFLQIKKGGFDVLRYRTKRLLMELFYVPLYVLMLPAILFIRFAGIFFIIRFGQLESARIGHLAGNTELYLCEKDAGINVPNKPYLDIFYSKDKPICNKFLIKKWSEVINIWPSFIVHPLYVLNSKLPNPKKHAVGTNSNHDRDIHNLLDKFPAHLTFSKQEVELGNKQLEELGVTKNSKFVCLLVRDSSYLSSQFKHIDWSYHNYRDCNIENYFLCADELTRRGYFVIRMGAKVASSFNNGNPMIIDYANSSMRSEFLDVYIGANCEFCISTSSGWDAIPYIFRKPIVYAPIVPLGYMFTFSNNYFAITKHHIDKKSQKKMSLKEILNRGVGFCINSNDFDTKGVSLIENTPEEILELVKEFDDKLTGRWITLKYEENLQRKFWEKFPVNSNDFEGKKMHGKIKAHFGTSFLRTNKYFLK